MTIAQICLIIYLCCFLCSIAGVYCIHKEVKHTLRKEGYDTSNIIGVGLSGFLAMVCPFLNALLACILVAWYEELVNYSLIDLRKRCKKL